MQVFVGRGIAKDRDCLGYTLQSFFSDQLLNLKGEKHEKMK